MKNEIINAEPTELATIPPQTTVLDVGGLIKGIIESGVTGDNVAAVKELAALYEHQEHRAAKKAWVAAFARVAGRMGTVNATREVKMKSGATMYTYASLVDIQDEVEPVLHQAGLYLRFDSRIEGNRCIGVCYLMHEAGHVEKAECAIAFAGAKGDDMGALTTAKRGAMIALLGIRIEHDEDARMLGDVLNDAQITELKAQLKAVHGDEKKFLAFAGADTWEEIRQGRLPQLEQSLRQKAKTARKPELTPDGEVIPDDVGR